MKKLLKQCLVIFLITYLLVECMCFISIKTGFIRAGLPKFFSDKRDTTVFPFSYADIDPYWGVWHYHYPVKVPFKCIDIECIPNSVGARDKERIILGDSNRVIVLGDSFLEGFGVPVTSRVSDLLEKKTGREFLNFACADMGSTQEYLVYKYLASSYTHNTILIGILPDNDFLNDNIGFDSLQTPLRYKPYWNNNLELRYYADDINQSQFTYKAFKEYKSTFKYKLRYFLENTTCWFNVFYYISKRKNAADFIQRKTEGKIYSGYYDFNAEELSRLQKSLVEIKKLATGKKMIIFTIPVEKDFKNLGNNKTTPLTEKLRQFALLNNITYYDLLTQNSNTDYKKLFFDCDDHWNEKGNQWAFEKLQVLFK
jgi:hypothetical protein